MEAAVFALKLFTTRKRPQPLPAAIDAAGTGRSCQYRGKQLSVAAARQNRQCILCLFQSRCDVFPRGSLRIAGDSCQLSRMK